MSRQVGEGKAFDVPMLNHHKSINAKYPSTGKQAPLGSSLSSPEPK